MSDFVPFLRAVLRHATYLFTSSVLAAFLTVVEHVRGASITERVFLGLTVVLLVGAFYKTWLEKHHEVVRLDSALLETKKELETERSKKPVEEAQAKLLDAQREEIAVREKARRAERNTETE